MPDGMETMTEDEIYAYIDENVAEDKKEDMKEMTRLLLKDFRGVSERKKLIAFFDSALEGTDSTVSGTDVYTLLTAMSKPQKLQYLTLMLKVASNPNDIELPDVAPGGESGNDNGGKAGAAQTETTAPEEPEIKYSLSTYEENIEILGVTDPETPDTISLYPVDFEAKERIKKIIDEYNEKMKLEDNESGVIAYNDYVSFIMEGTTQIINVITYILIAFVAISLIVSSIMISVITRISVLERTKEIGILRAIGASRSDISHVFNSETIIIGFFSGVMGVLLSLLMILPINAIIRHAANIDKLASLPVYGVIALIAISVLLNLIAGLSPSRKAAKQDPVIALRSE